MTEPTHDKILLKAMELAAGEGKTWLELEELDNERDERVRLSTTPSELNI
jgi:hypothetical protein